MTRRLTALLLLGAVPVLAAAEVKHASPDAMLIEHRYTVAASAARVWDSLGHPERWWPSDHTWSGDRANLSLATEAGGCFCEIWEGGSAEHGRVVMAQPGRLLRIRAALGPLQEMAIAGVITVALEEKDGRTEVVVTHRVSGDPSHALDKLAPIVDHVNGQQFAGLVTDAGGSP